MSKAGNPLFLPLHNEFYSLMDRARLPMEGVNALGQVHFSPAGLQALGEFLIRPDVWPCLHVGINEMERYSAKRPKGRPKVEALASQDARRAFRLWEAVKMLREFEKAHGLESTAVSNRNLIEAQMKVEPRIFAGEPDEWLFPTTVAFETLEQSVSRGKTKLKIDPDWQSELCEEILAV
jgi:hypothetical protein